MKWIKKGIIFEPRNNYWFNSHSSIPTPIIINDKIRIYYSARNKSGQSLPSFFETELEDPTKITYVHDQPIFDLGKPGTFDDNGVLLCSIVKSNNSYYMFYAGFEICNQVRYRLLSGLAFSDDDGITFKRLSNVPILDRVNKEYLFRGGPFCLKDKNIFRLWYCSGESWIRIKDKDYPKYEISYLETKDISNWKSKPVKQIQLSELDEHAFGRPYIIRNNNNSYEMYYSIRSIKFAQYRLGYATSKDGYNWTRKDLELNLDVSRNGFDNEAIMYASPIKVNNKIFLFYNGNDFGADGIGLANRDI